ncbi:MAG: GyrI-like domain-containing protein [Bacteroidota bacterium]
MRTATRGLYTENIHSAIEFVENSYHRDIQLTEIAEQACLSKYHFHRIFKSLTGETVKAFLTRIRLEKAAVKLKYGKEAIASVAFSCGYQNHETFTRAFKEYFGVPPQKYRIATHDVAAQKRQDYKINRTTLSDLNVEGPMVKTIPDLHLAYIRKIGSYDTMGNILQQLLFWAAEHSVLQFQPTTLGIIHDYIDLTAEEHLRFDSCVLVKGAIKPEGEIRYKKISGGKFAVFRYQGAFEEFYPVYDYIYTVCLFENQFELDDKPLLEWYIQSPVAYKPSDYLTDFYIAIK